MATSGQGGRKQVVGTRRANTTRPTFRVNTSVRRNKPAPTTTGPVSFHFEDAHRTAGANIAKAADAAVEAYNKVLAKFFSDHVLKVWPVRTGFSRAQLQLTADAIGETLRMRIQNLASYAAYIRQNKYRTPNAAKRILWDHMDTLGDQMMERLGRFIETR